MFAEFEKIIHEAAEAGESLTREFFCQRYYELNQKYFSGYVEVDKEIEMEWGRIPHFYTSFYVYKYATGFSAAVALSSAILKNGETAVEKYKKFLMSGGSDYPIELLKKAGVDLSDSKPIQSAMDEFERVLDEFERYYS
jgi:oligoendopeptidase F